LLLNEKSKRLFA